jgi:uncharacterized protein YoxC
VSGRAEAFLGIIAIATLATALIQIGALVAIALLARRLERVVARVEREVRPIAAHLDRLGQDATKLSALAVTQVERVDVLFADVADRVEQTVGSVQSAVSGPVREGAAVMAAFRAVLNALKNPRPRRSRGRGDEEDALFI